MRPAIWAVCVAGAMPLAGQAARIDTVRVFDAPLLVHRYRPPGPPVCPAVLLLSGDGGWELGVVGWAELLRDEGHEVAGVDAARLVHLAGERGLRGIVDAWPDLARLTAGPTVVLGYSRGANLGLVFATHATAPLPVVLLGVDLSDHFGGPAVPEGLAPAVHTGGQYAVDLRPLYRDRSRTTRVAVVHGMQDRVSPYAAIAPWLDSLPDPKQVVILPHSGHGLGDRQTVQPAIRDAVTWAGEEICR